MYQENAYQNSPELIILNEFLENVGSNSHQTDVLLAKIYNAFVKDVGLKERYEQFEIDKWISEREKRNEQPNNNCRYFLQKFMTFLEQDHLILRPLSALPPPINRPVLTLDKKEPIYNAIKSREWRMTVKGELDTWIDPHEIMYCVRLADVAGLRISEVVNVHLRDFVVQNGVCKLLVLKSKGNKSRKILIPFDFYNDLVNQYISVKNIKYAQKLFNNLDTTNLARIFERACIIAGFYKITTYERNRVVSGELRTYTGTKKRSLFSFHDLRRARATEMDRMGYSLADIKIFLGHTSISTTQRYIRKDEDELLKKLHNEAIERRHRYYKETLGDEVSDNDIEALIVQELKDMQRSEDL